jgi:hypothetical protein
MVQSSFSVQQLTHSSAQTNAYSRILPHEGAARKHRGQAQSRIQRLDALLLVLFALGTVALLLRGWQFYTLSVGERVDHPDFRVLAPSTSLGRAYGIAGACMIFTNLLYLVRRRFARLSLGSLRAWLDIHTFTGLFGGLLVVFHSAFQVRSSIAVITVASLFVVISTGLVGRSLHALAPRPDRLRLERHLALLDCIGPGLGQAISRHVSLVARTRAAASGSLLRALAALPSFAREARQRRSVIDRTLLEYARHFGSEMRSLAQPIADCKALYAREVRAAAAEALLESWRGLHRLCALLMVLLVVMHIAIAWYYGFVWALAR